MLGNKKKKFYQLKKGDKIWILTNAGHYESGAPALYEAEIWEDSRKQQSLSFPEYCHVCYYCPKLNQQHYLNVSLHGEESIGYNEHRFFTSKGEARRYQKKVAKERLERKIMEKNAIEETIKELEKKIIEG